MSCADLQRSKRVQARVWNLLAGEYESAFCFDAAEVTIAATYVEIGYIEL